MLGFTHYVQLCVHQKRVLVDETHLENRVCKDSRNCLLQMFGFGRDQLLRRHSDTDPMVFSLHTNKCLPLWRLVKVP